MNSELITTGKEGTVLRRLTGPMVLGILGMIVFNLMDTFYVGRIGSIELAALSFTFPVVLIIGSIANGLGVGMTATVSRATGEKNREKQRGLITWGLALSLIIVALFVILGLLTIDPLFRLLGADEKTLPVIREYMGIWYSGVIFIVVPMIGNAAIRGIGDTRTPAVVMLIAAAMNAILDPLLIFGIGPFPELGVRGAAIATLISRALTFFVSSYVLMFREKVIGFGKRTPGIIAQYWKELLHIGVPNVLTKLILPLSAGIITGLIARYGTEAVAGFGVSTRLEMFALLPINALMSVIPVFIGQNLGARREDRVIKGLKISRNFSLIYGALIYLSLIALAKPVGYLFNSNPDIVRIIALYMYVMPAAYGAMGLMQIGVTSLNVLKKPVQATIFTLLQIFAIYIPLAWLGSEISGLSGIFIAQAISLFIMGPISYGYVVKILSTYQESSLTLVPE